MKTIYKIVSFALISVLISCNSAPSLQKYFVESKENNAFISVDLPTSIIQLKNDSINTQDAETLKTIKKINFLALQSTDTNTQLVSSEKEKIQTILKNPKYKQLLHVKVKGADVTVDYLGNEEAVDEAVIFAYDAKKGFAVVRVIGENMNPNNIFKMLQKIQVDKNANQLKQITDLFN